jgi:hypothetical protein
MGMLFMENLKSSEIMFIGIISSKPTGFPLAIGFGFPDNSLTQTVLISPPEEWNIFDSKNQEKDERISKLNKRDLYLKGVPPEEAVNTVLSASNGREIFSYDNIHDQLMFGKICKLGVEIKSVISLFTILVGFKMSMELEIHTRLSFGYYPHNPADVRWMIPCYHACKRG